MTKPDAVLISINKANDERAEIVGELWFRTKDQYDYQLVDLFDKLGPGEYEMFISHYKEIKE